MTTTPTDTATFMNTGLRLFAGLPFMVKDLSDAAVRYGRKEMELALVEMPGLAALRGHGKATLPKDAQPR